MKTLRFLVFPFAFLTGFLLSACRDSAEKLGKGFRLPEGNPERGQLAFLELKCQQCHTIAGVTLPNPEAPAALVYELGGEVRKVKSYGELVTAITQPQHIVAPEYLAKLGAKENGSAVSPMPAFNDQMTVTQLADIVTYLHGHYQKAPPPGRTYPYYLP
jgi:L-cysteine S-thiosulfotransferase